LRLSAPLAWSGFAEADPLLVGLAVGIVVVLALGYTIRRLRSAERHPWTGATRLPGATVRAPATSALSRAKGRR
jgi:hypothetical protein